MQMEEAINKSSTALLHWWKVLQKEAIQVQCKRILQQLPVRFIKEIKLDSNAELLGEFRP